MNEKVFKMIEDLKNIVKNYDEKMKELESLIEKLTEKNQVTEEIKVKLNEFHDFLNGLQV